MKKIRRGVYVPEHLDQELRIIAKKYDVSVPYLIVLAVKLVDRSKMFELLDLTASAE